MEIIGNDISCSSKKITPCKCLKKRYLLELNPFASNILYKAFCFYKNEFISENGVKQPTIDLKRYIDLLLIQMEEISSKGLASYNMTLDIKALKLIDDILKFYKNEFIGKILLELSKRRIQNIYFFYLNARNAMVDEILTIIKT